MEMKSPLTCPYSVTVRRNPHRKARPTPATNAPPIPNPSSNLYDIPSFPIDDILSIEIPQKLQPNPPQSSAEPAFSENLKVFLRIRPLKPLPSLGKVADSKSRTTKIAWPQNPLKKNTTKEKKINKKSDTCVVVNDSRSITLLPPPALQDAKKIKSEIYEGFSHVFSPDSSQGEVYDMMVNPLVEDFLRGKSGMLAALGPSGSGKTHTVFGCPREPGMIPLILRKIFKQADGSDSEPPRTFYLSMFEIYSERGKSEGISDLLRDGGDIVIQQSTIKGLQESIISGVAEAESLIARGMLRRATASTNTNSQSSRSQCIINIRMVDEKVDAHSESAVLTIVDLAGAEREKRTGNQGARLLESNFINNTSMVFGLCLRSLLEHQKNPKKQLQKHFQNSLLTRYLRDYLEGKKRMTLILTAKSGEEDYLDTSFLLRQASPYMKIKFDLVEKPSTSRVNKRQLQMFPRSEQQKRVKVNGVDACEIEEGKNAGSEHQLSVEEVTIEKLTKVKPVSVLLKSPEVLKTNTTNNAPSSSDHNLENMERNNQIMQNFAKALWNVLKEYKKKIEVAESEVYSLRIEKERYLELEKELSDLKSRCSCSNGSSVEGASDTMNTKSEVRVDSSPLEGLACSNLHESNVDTHSPNHDASEWIGPSRTCDSSSIRNDQYIHLQRESSVVSDLSNNVFEQHNDKVVVDAPSTNLMGSDCGDREQTFDATYTNQKHESSPGNLEDAEDFGELKILGIKDSCSDEEKTGSRLSEVVVSSFPSINEISDVSSSSVEVDTELDEVVVDAPSTNLMGSDCGDREHAFDATYTNQHESSSAPGNLEDAEDFDELKILGINDSCSDEEKTGSRLSEVVVSSFPSINEISDDNSSSVEVDTELDEKLLDRMLSSEEGEAVIQESNDGNVQESEERLSTSCKPIGVDKPKRKLLPASSILLRAISCLDFEDENERPKGNRGEKKLAADERYRTQVVATFHEISLADGNIVQVGTILGFPLRK